MSHLREEGDHSYRLDWYVLVTKTGKGGHRTGKGCFVIHRDTHGKTVRVGRPGILQYKSLFRSVDLTKTDQLEYMAPEILIIVSV